MSMESRVCLKCQKDFDSKGPGNRICPKCKRTNDYEPTSRANSETTKIVTAVAGYSVGFDGRVTRKPMAR